MPPRKANGAAIPLQTRGLGSVEPGTSLPTTVQLKRSAFLPRHRVTVVCHRRDRLQPKPPQTALPWQSVLQPHPSWSPGTQKVSPPSSHVSYPSCPVVHRAVSLHGRSWTLRSGCCHTSPLLRGSIHPRFCQTALPRFAWQLQ